MPETFANYVAGKWVPAKAGKTFDKANPADNGDFLGRFASADATDVEDAVAAAKAALPKWNAGSVTARETYLFKAAEIVERRADEIAAAITRENGKTLKEAKGETLRAAQILRFFAGEARRITGETYPSDSPATFLYTLRCPVGVVAAITPWNFPIAIPIWKIAPAIVYGNTVVLKVSKEAPHLGVLIAQVFEQAGLPAGVLNMLTGPGGTSGDALLHHPDVAAVSYTGSCEVGARVASACAKHGKKYQLEMGGQNPVVVMPDCDLEQAVDAVWMGAFLSAGQKCTATSRTIVHEAFYERFRARLLEKTKALKVGPGTDPATVIGPLINNAAVERILDGVETAKKAGAAVIAGGRKLTDGPLARGNFVEPTILENVRPDSPAAQEEYFGPFMALMRCKDVEEGIALANGVKFGLSASIFTGSISDAQKFVKGVQAGMVHVNSQTAGAEAHVPFGGMKASSNLVREQGRAAMEFYTVIKTVYLDPPAGK
jgi:aldehyde dehydrogenase (NAD+)